MDYSNFLVRSNSYDVTPKVLSGKIVKVASKMVYYDKEKELNGVFFREINEKILFGFLIRVTVVQSYDNPQSGERSMCSVALRTKE